MAPTDELWTRADRLFEAALDLPAGERAPFLDAECGDDGELRALVDRLLASVEETEELPPGGGLRGPLLAGLAEELAAEVDGDGDVGAPGQVVGRYRIVRELGRGGMAVVYLAERADGQFRQEVALKILRLGFDSEEMVERFDQERQILAAAHHPHIAQLLDGGVAEDGRPYLAMEYVEGWPIDDYCDRRRLSVPERLRLFVQVARAVDYAHRNLAVHRDIKPSNILVTDDGHVKLLDFGIAKLLDADLAPGGEPVTRSFARMMTPIYASPEQILGEPVTTASDVYQLGVLLYLLLSGRWPYRIPRSSPGDVIRAICHDPPTRPSTAVLRSVEETPEGEEPSPPEAIGEARGTSPPRLRRQLAGDLDHILLKALAKEPEDRYGSVSRLIEDVERHLAQRPIAARPATLGYRAAKFVRRHAAACVTGAAALLLLVTLAFFYTLELTRERDRAQQAAAEATQVSEFLRGLFEVSAPTRSKGEEITARELLDQGAQRVEVELARQPELRATMMTLIGHVYGELALYEEARPLLERAVEIRRGLGDGEAEGLAESLYVLGLVLTAQSQPLAAGECLEVSLAIRRRLLGADHPEVGRTLDALGVAVGDAGDFAGARRFHEESLAILEAALGPEHPEVGKVLANLGSILRETREYEGAKEVLQRALRILERSQGADHPHSIRARYFLGDALRYTGDVEGADAAYGAALPLAEKTFGPDHPEVARVLLKLGNLKNAGGDAAGARPHLERALAIYEQSLGPEDVRVGWVLNSLGMSFWVLEDPTAARPYFERAVAAFEVAEGAEESLATALRNLAEVLEIGGDPAAAVPLFERAIAIRERLFGEDHSILAGPLFKLGRTHRELGDPAAAEPLLRRALAVGRDREPHRHPEVIWPRLELARCLIDLGRGAEAEELLRQTLDDPTVQPESHRLARELLAGLGSSR